MDRRGFIKAAFALMICMGPAEALARQEEAGNTLRLYNTHTEEFINISYKNKDGYVPESIERLNNFMRCHYNDEVHEMDPKLFDMLSEMDRAFGGGRTIHIISGYRSPEYNAILASRSDGVARHSLHMQGLAVDFRIPGVRMSRLFRKVRAMGAGGAGLYTEFVHMDTGRVRTWGIRA